MDSKSSVERVTLTLDALHCGALLIHRDGRVVHANARLCEMVGRAPEQLRDVPIISFYQTDDDRAVAQQMITEFDQTHEYEFHVPRADGGKIPVLISARPLEFEGLVNHRIVTVVDLGPIKQAEERTQELYVEVAQLSDTILTQALDLKQHAKVLEERVRRRTQDLHEANMDAIYMLAIASEVKDADTGAHVRRIETYSERLSLAYALPDGMAREIGYSSILHDVGKMQIPDEIIKKPSSLDVEERRVMESHTTAGERILSQKPFFAMARQIARSHHENWDGSGYPDGLSGTQIPLPARIVHVVDVFDALIKARAYKAAIDVKQALSMIREGRGTMFDPELVDVFVELVDRGEFNTLMHGEYRLQHDASPAVVSN